MQSEYEAPYRRLVKMLSSKCNEVYGFLDDLHYNGSRRNGRDQSLFFYARSKLSGIFSSYAYCSEQSAKFRPPLIWFPHSVRREFIPVFNRDPARKFLLSGVRNATVYPERDNFANLKGQIPTDHLEYLGYSKNNHQHSGERYLSYISKYIASFTCASYEKTPYLLAKFFEIPASGALLLASDHLVKDQMYEMGFRDGVNYLSVDGRDPKDLLKKAKYVLNPDNRDTIDRIRLNGYQLIQERHLLTHRYEILDGVLN